MLTIFGNVPNPYKRWGYEPTSGALGTFINNIITTAMIVGGLAFFFMLIYGGYSYLTSAGNEDAIERSGKIITYAAIGIIIVAGAWFAVKILETILGVPILNPEFTGPTPPSS